MEDTQSLPVHIRRAFSGGGTVTHMGQQFDSEESLLAAFPDIATAHEGKAYEHPTDEPVNPALLVTGRADTDELNRIIGELRFENSQMRLDIKDASEYITLLQNENAELKIKASAHDDVSDDQRGNDTKSDKPDATSVREGLTVTDAAQSKNETAKSVKPAAK